MVKDLVDVDRVIGSYSSSIELLAKIANTLSEVSYNGIFSPLYQYYSHGKKSVALECNYKKKRTNMVNKYERFIIE